MNAFKINYSYDKMMMSLRADLSKSAWQIHKNKFVDFISLKFCLTLFQVKSLRRLFALCFAVRLKFALNLRQKGL